MTREEEEVYTYDLNNFVADTGGFLGLLLGLSAMDLVQFGYSLSRKINGKNKSKGQKSVNKEKSVPNQDLAEQKYWYTRTEATRK